MDWALITGVILSVILGALMFLVLCGIVVAPWVFAVTVWRDRHNARGSLIVVAICAIVCLAQIVLLGELIFRLVKG